MRLAAKPTHLMQAHACESTTWRVGLGKVEIRATVAKIQLFLNESSFCCLDPCGVLNKLA